jgi:peptidoglycan/LPS O-acetylase OafA/YrhL
VTAYLTYTKRLADQTPAARNRVIDLWRAVAIAVVVLGHWLAASIWRQPDGEIALLNSLQWIPYAAWVTWIVQVMPIFFFVGGYANARALHKVIEGAQRRRDWVTIRARRLFTPVVPLLVVWTVLILAMRPFVPADVVHAGAMAATVPLWFMAVYLTLTALAPFTHRWWRAMGLGSLLLLAAVAVAVDLARFVLHVPGIGFLNFLVVWGAVHQAGYWWAARDDGGRPVAAGHGAAVAGVSLAALIAVTWIGWYPVAMVGVPGAGLTNMTPPTAAIGLLGSVQAGIIWWTQRPVAGIAARPQVWHGVVAFSGVIMTLYLWHLTAMALIGAAGLFTFGGVVFSVEPGTTMWWLTRPLWVIVLGAVTAVLVAGFARFEWRISDRPGPNQVQTVVLGVVLAAASSAAVAWYGLAGPSAEINWIIPAAALLGAGLVGAYPRSS